MKICTFRYNACTIFSLLSEHPYFIPKKYRRLLATRNIGIQQFFRNLSSSPSSNLILVSYSCSNSRTPTYPCSSETYDECPCQEVEPYQRICLVSSVQCARLKIVGETAQMCLLMRVVMKHKSSQPDGKSQTNLFWGLGKLSFAIRF